MQWSATWPKEVQKLAAAFLGENPIKTQIGSTELVANHSILQNIHIMSDHDKEKKLDTLIDEIMTHKRTKTIVFTSTKKKADDITRNMRRDGWPAMVMHGDKAQQERDWVLNEFRTGNAPILVATDVAARGLDVKDVRYVINYDFPNNTEDYVHRIGRTGRAGSTGISHTFFTTNDAKQAGPLVRLLEEADQVIPETLRQMASFSGGSGGGGGGGGECAVRIGGCPFSAVPVSAFAKLMSAHLPLR